MNSPGFLEWAGDLADDAPLTAGRVAEFARVGCSEVGVNSWCRSFLDRSECQRLIVHLRRHLQEGIVRVSDRLRLPVEVLPTNQPFTSVLHAVSRWLATAEAANAPPPRVLPDFDRDTVSPFGLSGVPSNAGPIPPPVRSLGELRALLAGFADVYQSLALAIPDGATAPFFESLRDRLVDGVRAGLSSHPWFDPLRARLASEFGLEPSVTAVNRFVALLSRQRSLRPAQTEALPVEDALGWRRGRPRPVWDAAARVLTAGGWRKTARGNGKTVIAILGASEAAGWPDGAVAVGTISTAADRKKCLDRFLKGAPLEIRPDGTGSGMAWRWTSAG